MASVAREWPAPLSISYMIAREGWTMLEVARFAGPRECRTENDRRADPDTKQKPRAVAILPRGEAIRNFVYTDVLDELMRNVEVTVLSVLPSQEIHGLL